MTGGPVYRYEFDAAIDGEAIEKIVTLAILGVESLHGESEARLKARHFLDAGRHVCVVEAGSEVGLAFNKLLVGFATRHFGPDAFTVQRIVDQAGRRFSGAHRK